MDLKAIMGAAVAASLEAAQKSTFRDDIINHLRLNPARFPAVSLCSWLQIAELARVPSVPSEVVAELEIEPLLRFDEPDMADHPVFATLTEVLAQVPEQHMLRWDACSSIDLKQVMANGGDKERVMSVLSPADPRAFDILYEYPKDTIAIHCRPWIEARLHASHPVEYRVFVKAGEIAGVSSYYPQRSLADYPDAQQEVDRCIELSEQMLAVLKAEGITPWMPQQGNDASENIGIQCTLDFLVSDQGEVLFLEAGPGFGFGAHPCCFEGREVRGVALAKDE